jgi:CRISPR/Cas system-associated exonuclease Cas4 (RecB family)
MRDLVDIGQVYMEQNETDNAHGVLVYIEQNRGRYIQNNKNKRKEGDGVKRSWTRIRWTI